MRPAPTSDTCSPTTSPTRPTATSTTAGRATTQRGTAGCGTTAVPAKTQETMGYFTRDEIPFQYAMADAFTICDGYHQAIMAPTSPNRMYFWTGTSAGWTSNPDDYTVDFGSDAGTPRLRPIPNSCRRPASAGRCTRTTRSATAAASLTISSATTATTRCGSTSGTTPPTASMAAPACWPPAGR